MTFPRIVALLAGGASLFAPAAAQQPAPASTPPGPSAPGADILVTGSVYKLDVPERETPQAIATLGREALDRRNVQSVEEALRYVPGVQAELAGRSGYDEFLIRGFSQSRYQFRDGLRLDPGYLQQQEQFGLERIEVLKGPASVLYGQIAPGGLVNSVSKLASPDRHLDLEGTVGGYGVRRATIDIGGAVDADGTLSLRLPALYSERDDPQRFVDARRWFLAPSATLRLGGDTRLTVLGLYQDDSYDRTTGQPVEGTVRPNPNGRILRAFWAGEPSLPRIDSPQWQLGYLLEHDVSRALRFRSKLRYLDYDVRGPLYLGSALDASLRTLPRKAFFYDANTTSLASDHQFEGVLATGAIEHRLLVGADTLRFRATSSGERFDLPAIDVFAPVYGGEPSNRRPFFASRSKLDETGIYGQYRAELSGRLVALAGIRRSFVDNVSVDRSSGVRTRQKDQATTLNGALMALLPGGVSPYVSYAESFQPQFGYDPLTNGQTPPPAEGRQWEGGAKWETPDRSLSADIAVYRIVQSNVVNGDPANPGFSLLVGRQRHRGIEVNLAARPVPGVTLRAGYAHVDARITESLNGDEGFRPANVAAHNASGLLTLDGAAIGVPRADGFVGVRYLSRREAGLGPTGPSIPGYAAVDLGLGYRLDRYRLGLYVKNLFDRRYYTGVSSNEVVPGDPASVELSLRATF